MTGSLETVSWNVAAAILRLDAPCSVNTALSPPSSSTLFLRNTTLPFHVWRCCASSECYRWQMSMVDATRTGRSSFFTGGAASVLGVTFLKSQAGRCTNLSHALSTAASVSRIFIASLKAIGLCTKPWRNSDTYPCSEMWSVCLCGVPAVPALFADSHSSRFLRACEYRHSVGIPATFLLGNARH